MIDGRERVTILMPVGAATPAEQLSECLESIAAQTYRPLHLLTVLNPPKAELRAMLDAFSESTSGITSEVIEAPRVGLPAALNLGLDRTADALVARMDADDVMHPERIAVQVGVMGRRPEAVIVSSTMRQFASQCAPAPVPAPANGLLQSKQWTKLTWAFLLRNPVNHPTVMMRRKIVQAIGAYNPRLPLCEDEDLWQRIYASHGEILEIQFPLLSYRVHAGSYSQSPAAMLLRNAIRLWLYYCNFRGSELVLAIAITLMKASLIPARLTFARLRNVGHPPSTTRGTALPHGAPQGPVL